MASELIPRDHLAAKAATARKMAGQAPAIAPRAIIQSPIWHDPRVAVKLDAQRWDWQTGEPGLFGRRRIMTVNDVVVTGSGAQGSQGLLRWLDLDILIALSYEMFRLGSRDITVENKLLLKWMGYQHLEDPPYNELRASINRLANTTVQVVRPTLESAEPYERILNSRLLGEGRVETRRGGGGGIHVVATEQWLAALVGDGQAIDVRAYLHLVRRIRGVSEEQGDGGIPNAARSVLLFLDSWRRTSEGSGPGMESVVKVDWLRDRFAERHGGPHVPHSRPPDGVSSRDWYWSDREPPTVYRYRDPWAEQGRLYRAIKSLVSCGVIDADVTRGDDRLMIRWNDPRKLDAIPAPEKDQQQRLFKVSQLTGEVLPGDAVTRLDPPDPAGVPASSAAQSAASVTASSVLSEPLAADLAFMSRLIVVSRKILARASDNGYTDRHLRHLYMETLWKKHCQEIRDPGAFAASEILNKPPIAYETTAMRLRLDVDAMLTWWTGPSGPKALARASADSRSDRETTASDDEPAVSVSPSTPKSTSDVVSYLQDEGIPAIKRRLREVRKMIDGRPAGDAPADIVEEREDLEEALTSFANVVTSQDVSTSMATLQMAAVTLYAGKQDLIKSVGGKILALLHSSTDGQASPAQGSAS